MGCLLFYVENLFGRSWEESLKFFRIVVFEVRIATLLVSEGGRWIFIIIV